MVRVKRQNPTRAARIERAAHLAYIDGATETEIAKASGIKEVTVRDWKKTPEWDAGIERLRSQQLEYAEQRLAMLTAKATSAIEEILDCDDLHLKLKVSTWLLERADSQKARRPAALAKDRAGMIDHFVSAVVESSEVDDVR